ncbi:MAG TPA: NAD(P)H-dependent oxidoreductase [Streptosporangiaceae bacterium]|nr:NAD(P)H-dependent oxidoreductase [Streptosporangiaceae bacterium]
MNFTVVVGNPKPESRTLGVALAAAEALADGLSLRAGPTIVDLSVLARRLLLPEPCAAVEDAADQVLSADLLLVASPTFKGTYSGLLKVFLDRLPYRGLQGTTALPVLVMNSPLHALAVGVHLRPLLLELGAAVPAPGLAVLESELDRLDLVLGPWTSQVAKTVSRQVPDVHLPGRQVPDRAPALSGLQ